VIFIDHKDRRYFSFLEAGRWQDIRGHRFSHDAIMGQEDGLRMESSRGRFFTIMRATLPDYIVQMPRYATVIYPKDLATILVWADIQAGHRVLEAGLGSGGLAIALLRAIGPTGHLDSYELRPEALNRGAKNVAAYFGGAPENHTITVGDVYAGIQSEKLDRIVLDVPEPWQVVPHAAEQLVLGGIFCAYSPTVLQVAQTGEALRYEPRFGPAETYETIMRPWHVTHNSVRPELSMVGHTGFLTFARKLQPMPPRAHKARPDEASPSAADAGSGEAPAVVAELPTSGEG